MIEDGLIRVNVGGLATPRVIGIEGSCPNPKEHRMRGVKWSICMAGALLAGAALAQPYGMGPGMMGGGGGYGPGPGMMGGYGGGGGWGMGTRA